MIKLFEKQIMKLVNDLEKIARTIKVDVPNFDGKFGQMYILTG